MSKAPKTISATLPASEFDAAAYFNGIWYEQARTLNRFQAGCVKSTAFYEFTGQRVTIENSCVQADGSVKAGPRMSASARPFYPDQASYNVMVTFIPGGLYNVLYVQDVGGAAGTAIVAGRRFDKVWILTRQETVSPQTVDDLKKIANTLHSNIAWM